MRLGSLLVAPLLVALAAALPAQTTWYVDPALGDDGNSGLTENDAFQTLNHAMAVASAGDTVLALDGTYGPLQTWAVTLKDGVALRAAGDAAVLVPTFPSAAFSVSGDITQPTLVEGFTVMGADVGLVASGVRLSGLEIHDCTFQDVTGTAVALTGSAADDHDVLVAGCTFTGNGGDTALRIECTADGGNFVAGGITDCSVLGGFQTGIELVCDRGTGNAASASFGAGFVVARNQVEALQDGILVHLDGVSGLPGQSFTFSAPIRSNTLDGPVNAPGAPPAGVPSKGLRGLASSSNFVTGVSCVWDGEVSHNVIAGFQYAFSFETVQPSGPVDVVDLVPVLRGNVAESLVQGGGAEVSVASLAPNPAERNVDPDFGAHPAGDGTRGRNFFLSITDDFQLSGQPADLTAVGNWWSHVPPVVVSDTSAGVVYHPALAAEVAGEVAEPLPAANDPDAEVSIEAAEGHAFLDDPDPLGPVQALVKLDGVTLPPEDATVEDDGNRLRVRIGAVSEGEHELAVASPDLLGPVVFSFQTAPEDVGGGEGGGGVITPPGTESGGSGGCFVATAANGDYDAPDVVALRGLRDEYLALTPPGRAFVRWYYAEGPQAAAWIAERPWARAATRAALKPLVWTSEGLNGLNPGQRLALAVACLGAALGLRRTLRP